MCEGKDIKTKEIKLWHNKVAQAYHNYLFKFRWLVGRKVAELARIGKGHVILDVGCGSGRCTIPAKFEFGAEVVGVDISLKLLKILRELSKKEIPVVLGDATALPFRNNSFDHVISNEVWIHIPTSTGRKKYVCEIGRISKSGGTVFISGIRRAKFRSKNRWLEPVVKTEEPIYIHEFSPMEILTLFLNARLRILKIRQGVLSKLLGYSRGSKFSFLYKNAPGFLKSVLAWWGFQLIDVEAKRW